MALSSFRHCTAAVVIISSVISWPPWGIESKTVRWSGASSVKDLWQFLKQGYGLFGCLSELKVKETISFQTTEAELL